VKITAFINIAATKERYNSLSLYRNRMKEVVNIPLMQRIGKDALDVH